MCPIIGCGFVVEPHLSSVCGPALPGPTRTGLAAFNAGLMEDETPTVYQ